MFKLKSPFQYNNLNRNRNLHDFILISGLLSDFALINLFTQFKFSKLSQFTKDHSIYFF